jgi:SPX domain protein involved in polyphosphate accumulation
MSVLPSNPRFERKFVVQGLSLAEVLAVVKRQPVGFHETYPARSVNNIYLDSPELRDYHDHVNGIPYRTKTRIRWYGAWSGCIAAPTLEHKLKRGHVSGKVSNRLRALTMNGHLSKTDLEAVFDGANLPELTRLTLRHLQPSLLNRYRRHYFQSADGRFRLTVDSDLQFAPARQVQGTGVSFCPPATSVVIEVKYGLGEAEYAVPVTNALPFRLARCSKYVLGVATLAA